MKALPVRPAHCILHSSVFAKPFSSFSSLRRNISRSPLSEAKSVLNRDGQKNPDEKLQSAPLDGPSPDPSTDQHTDASTDQHRLTSDAAAPPNNIITRTALVGASVGLLTPLYVAAGVGWIWHTYKPSNFIGQAAKFAVGAVLFGAVFVNGWTVITQHVFPFVFNHAEIVLPFALANATVAAAWYAIGESIFGLQRMSGQTTIFNAFRMLLPENAAPLQQKTSLPLGGPLVGLLTALTCFPLWEPLSQRLWPHELLNACDSSVLANIYLKFLPVGLGTGAIVGLGLHFALAPIFTGRIVSVSGVPVALSLLIAVIALSLGYFYFCRFDYTAWEQRMDADSGQLFWAHSATGEKATSSERLLNDTDRFLKGLALFCNMNSMSNHSHFCFVNRRLLADALVADAKLSTRTHGSPMIRDAVEKSKSLLRVYYCINFKQLSDLILRLLHIQRDLRMALSLTDDALKADAVERCTQSKETLIAEIRSLSSNPDATVAIDHLLSDLASLETRLIAEAGINFSQGTGIVNSLMSSLRSFTQSPSKSSRQHSNRKSIAFIAVLVCGGIVLYAHWR